MRYKAGDVVRGMLRGRPVVGLVCPDLDTTVISTNCADMVERFWVVSAPAGAPMFEGEARLSLTGVETPFRRLVRLAPLQRFDVLVGSDLLPVCASIADSICAVNDRDSSRAAGQL
ncbi:MAG: hypothetical protein QOJ54_1027 [Aliidongia sp.]|nr:hypothetical protein [Aliidongia sp.]